MGGKRFKQKCLIRINFFWQTKQQPPIDLLLTAAFPWLNVPNILYLLSVPVGMHVVKIGGPVYRIGVGGGAASSIQVRIVSGARLYCC